MRIGFRKIYLIGISVAIAIILIDIFLLGVENRFFYPILIISLSIGWIHFWVDYLNEIKRQKRIEDKFLEF
ncbi:MAG TPA: hypothetical protein VI387_12105, partial [Candidatus Brocadiales bacterium]|nr:hypothetical protein [Candidatus Brocadiales bacterium]